MLLSMLQEKALMIQVTDNAIKYAEKILLLAGIAFDEQRINFIKNLTTIDLQAVPGSGKTTALLAKLLILEKHLPFQDGSGILVISHTNTAVDEIKEKISVHCPRLFNYPNFVGTIQSFVDQFLAMPFYANIYKRKTYRIDDDIYVENVYAPGKAKAWLNNNPNNKDKVLYESRLNEKDELTIGFNYSGDFPLKSKTSDTYISILEMKQMLLERGVLCFDDAYFLAIKAIRKYPILKRLLQRRFRYVFVDEMQDMDKHQHDLLEGIFYNDGNSSSIYQRIGDKNQAIFGERGAVKQENFWNSSGRTVLNIDGSCRFSKEIADVVQCFSLERQDIKGNSSHRSIKPHLLIYADNTIKNVLPRFIEIVQNKQSSAEIPSPAERAIKAIGWRKSSDGAKKVVIKDYFPEFNADAKSTKVDYSNLKDYILARDNNLSKKSLGFIRKNILNAFLRMLRYEEIRDSDGIHFTQSRLFRFLEEASNDTYLELRLKLFLWCRNIYRGNSVMVFEEMKEYFPKILHNIFGKKEMSQKTKDFINERDSKSAGSSEDSASSDERNNIYRYNGIEVEVGTIHSIKGETHSATLYLETYYHNDNRRPGNCISYESQRLKEYFKGNRTTGNEGKRVKESLKMAYVGMSRPTHLLCVAVHRDRVKDYLNEIPDSLWEKVEI